MPEHFGFSMKQSIFNQFNYFLGIRKKLKMVSLFRKVKKRKDASERVIKPKNVSLTNKHNLDYQFSFVKIKLIKLN